MRQAAALLLLCSLSVHCAGRLGIVARWWWQRDYVARVLCVNRDQPQRHCNGKCQLRRQLRAADAREARQHPAGSKLAFEEITLACPPLEPVELPTPSWYADPAPRYAALRLPHYAWERPGPEYPPAEG